jgi:small subunit ribosomal protein S5
MVRATFDALKGQNSPKMIANKRGKTVAEVLSSRRTQSAAEVSPE